MQGGLLKKRVVVEFPDEGRSADSGAIEPTWTTLITMWAKISPFTGKETFNAQQFSGKVTHSVTMRANAKSLTITPKMRLTYKGRIFNIHLAINVNEADKEMLILAEEQV
jgi:SPP1 family predicted phage head-tail adaptor